MSKKNVAVFINHPQCSVQSGHGIIKSLYMNYNVDCIGTGHLRDRILKKYDMIAVPGGIGDSDTWHDIIEPGYEAIINQISLGKKYLGICMGAYWAGSHYLKLLKGIEPVQYIKQDSAEIKRSFGTTVKVSWLDQTEHMYFYDGCCFLDQGGDYEVVARYANSNPAAIIQNNVGLIGPHPESDIYWYDKNYLLRHWHNYSHHQLLLKFVEKLFE